MLKTFLRASLLFFSIGIINSLAFGLGRLVHVPHSSTITAGQYADYQFTMWFMMSFLFVALQVLEWLHDFRFRSHAKTSIGYALVFATVTIVTYDQLLFRPYEHGLTVLCMVAVVATRRLFWGWLAPAQPQTTIAANLTF